MLSSLHVIDICDFCWHAPCIKLNIELTNSLSQARRIGKWQEGRDDVESQGNGRDYLLPFRYRSFAISKLILGEKMAFTTVKQIVVGIDFSESSKSALFHAVRLAKRQNAKVHMFHVVDELVLRELQEIVQHPRENVTQSVYDDAKRDMMEMLQNVDHGDGIDVNIDVRVGPMLHEIIEKVKQVQGNLLILGATSDPEKRSAVGTLALKCVRKVPTMVMLVRPPHRDLFKTIVVCVDFSEISERLIHHAAAIAVNEDAELHLLHVFAPPWDRLHYRAPTPQATVYFQTQFKRALQSRLESYLEILPAEIRTKLRVRCQLHEDRSYGYGVVDYANNCNADLVVLGTKGRTNLRYIFLGSTAERVVTNAPCSILAIKPLEYSVEEVLESADDMSSNQ